SSLFILHSSFFTLHSSFNMICPNCHTEFIGNFCPSCGQSAKTQRFTVKNVLMSTLEVWGMGNRSLPRTLFHLFTRPGYMIGEYLDGRRMPFFPPVKMLFVLCIFFALATTIVDGYHVESPIKKEDVKELKNALKEKIKAKADSTATADSSKFVLKNDSNKVVFKAISTKDNRIIEDSVSLKEERAEEEDPTEQMLFSINGTTIKIEDLIEGIKAAANWLETHKAIELLCLHCFFMLFSWRVFRKSPIRPKTTLAENFFSQVYISGQMMAASIVYVLIFGNTQSTFYPLPWWVLFGLFVWDFKQLFGYKWKATVRRTMLIHIYSFITFIVICAAGIIILGVMTGAYHMIVN
ncbi:MAG: DUF3667 domain-containing protein, partial [Prevotella sp.]